MALLTCATDCTGCTACMAACPVNCIVMKPDLFGFAHPELAAPDKCIDCGKCDLVCPIRKNKSDRIGIERSYAAFSNDEIIRERSSSGGLFSELSMRIISTGGVVYGAVYNDDFIIRHARIDNLKDLKKCCGAKYAQSIIDNIYIQVETDLKAGKTVLFSGTPCQIAGVRSYLSQDYDNLICIDFVCHGIPSPAAWEGYIKYRRKKADISSVNMRSKETGWSRYNYSIKFEYTDGSKYSKKSGEDIYLKLFVGDFINRESCENCHFKGVNRDSDLTLADFWGVWDLYPEMDDNKGISALIVHTQKGNILLEECKDRVTIQEIPINEISQQNPSLDHSSKAKPQRNDVLNLAINGEYDIIKNKYFPQFGLAERVKRKLGSFLHRQ